MNDTVATEDLEQPAKPHERKARGCDRDPDCRTSSRPAEICSAPTGRTYDRSRPNRLKRQKSACQGRPSTYEDFEFEIFFVAQAVGAALEDADFVVETLDEAERDVVGRLAVSDDAVPIALDHGGEFFVGREVLIAQLLAPGVEEASTHRRRRHNPTAARTAHGADRRCSGGHWPARGVRDFFVFRRSGFCAPTTGRF